MISFLHMKSVAEDCPEPSLEYVSKLNGTLKSEVSENESVSKWHTNIVKNGSLNDLELLFT